MTRSHPEVASVFGPVDVELSDDLIKGIPVLAGRLVKE